MAYNKLNNKEKIRERAIFVYGFGHHCIYKKKPP